MFSSVATVKRAFAMSVHFSKEVVRFEPNEDYNDGFEDVELNTVQQKEALKRMTSRL